ncbi:hypothetical protein [Mycobacterium deserti]|uniref:Uncharacterized protein n=1 Tax=Mycobacterium deserti TaxID=2978347 RepID=A0ABT2M849_9MYCO|nr:hypothetical protein [Mycobacterium deserti]MCT7658121.1 hypothetical protein [Mycobacterium deserti]
MPDSGGNSERGSIDDLPWASVFDPAANARALSAIQAEGFRAASQIVDRFIRIVAPDGSDSGPAPSHPPADGAPPTNVASDLETLTRSWWSMVGRMLLQSAPKATGLAGDGDTALDLQNAESAGQVNLEAQVGGSAAAEVWLHNRGADDFGNVSLRCSDLLSADGNIFQAESVMLEPTAVPMPARSSRGVELNARVAEYVRPGLYRGTLLVEGHPNLWLPVTLVVTMPAS